LISHLPRAKIDAPLRALATRLKLEPLTDDPAPRVKADERVSGGTSLLETQSRNPLWAFLRYRLGAVGLKAYSDLPPVTLRGEYIHKILERLWHHLKNQAALVQAISDGSIDGLLRDIAFDTAISKLALLPPILQGMELERDVALVRDWLDVEAARQPFKIHGLEAKQTFDFDVLKLRMTLDRVDQLDDGSLVVIDYKSSSTLANVLKDWNHPRPINLQLPAYAAILLANTPAENIAALILVQIHSKQGHGSETKSDSSAEGLTRIDLGVKGVSLFADQKHFVSADWPAAMHKLQDAVNGLAEEFIEGVARNESWRREDLTYCDIMPLLRLFDEGDDD
jgi:ATP-dependent helicase/DNAse subunit B